MSRGMLTISSNTLLYGTVFIRTFACLYFAMMAVAPVGSHHVGRWMTVNDACMTMSTGLHSANASTLSSLRESAMGRAWTLESKRQSL